jgi:hypothetical protein
MSIARNPDYKLLPSIWDTGKLMEALVKAGPTIGLLPKRTDFSETKFYQPTGYAAPQGIGTTYTGAKFTKTPSKAVEWELQHKHYYGVFSIDGFLWRQSEYGKRKAVLVDPVTRDSTNLVDQAKRDLSSAVFGNGGGALAQISVVSGTRITLTNGRDLRKFDVGMTIQTSTTDGTSGSVNSGQCVISAVGDESNPFIDVEGVSAAAGIPSIAANDYVFRYDTFGGMLSGLKLWLPAWSTSSLPGTAKGVNRDVAPAKLAGHYVDLRSFGPREGVMRLLRIVSDAGGTPDLYITSTLRWESLYNELASSNALTMTKMPAAKIDGFNFGVEYDAIKVMGPRGPCAVVADPDCPDSDDFALTKDTWMLGSMGPLLHWDSGSGPGDNRVEDGADAREYRLVGDMEMWNKLPFHNGRGRRS